MRLKKLCDRLGLELRKGVIDRDVDEVLYRGLKCFSVPAKLNNYPNSLHKWHGMLLPNYHDMAQKARFYWFQAKLSPWYKENIKEAANQKFNPQEYV